MAIRRLGKVDWIFVSAQRLAVCDFLAAHRIKCVKSLAEPHRNILLTSLKRDCFVGQSFEEKQVTTESKPNQKRTTPKSFGLG